MISNQEGGAVVPTCVEVEGMWTTKPCLKALKLCKTICSTNELSTTPRRARCDNPGDLIYNEDRNGTENCRTDVASPSNWTILRVDPDATKRAEEKLRVTRKGLLSGI